MPCLNNAVSRLVRPRHQGAPILSSGNENAQALHRYRLGFQLVPKFKTSKACKPRSDKLGSTSPNIKSWFPTVKGAERMEGLRHYFHKHMAMLLDARPDVDSWDGADHAESSLSSTASR